MKKWISLLALLLPGVAWAQTYYVDWFKVAGGGGTSTGGVYCVSDTIGQQDAGGPMQGPGYSVEGGFWSLYATQQAPGTNGSAPIITIQPQSQFVPIGNPVSFNVSVSGTLPFFYQWQRDGTNLSDNGLFSGSQTSNLLLSTTGTNEIGGYDVIIQNAYGSVTSSEASLTILLPNLPIIATNVYNAETAFSISNGNPNGNWSYTWSSSLDSTQTLYAITQTQSIAQTSWTEGWTFTSGAVPIPLVAANTTESQLGIWPPETLGFHPGYDGEFSHVVWTAPYTGNYSVNVNFTMLDSGNTEVYVVQRPAGGAPVHLANGNVTAASRNYSYSGTLTLNAGDQIDFAVGWGNGSLEPDTTALSPVISPVNVFPTIPPVLQIASLPGGQAQITWNMINSFPPMGLYGVKFMTNLMASNWIDLVYGGFYGISLTNYNISTSFPSPEFYRLAFGPYPVVSNLSATPARFSFTVTWTTSEPTSGQVNWGLGFTTIHVRSGNGYSTSHSIMITGLVNSSLYSFYVSGAGYQSATYEVTTSP
jgi:Immunoglobulin I-set domain